MTIAERKAKDIYKKLAIEFDEKSKYYNLDNSNDYDVSNCFLDKDILLQALEEGYVILSIVKLLLAGPPAVGKTSFKHLLFNWEPPLHHHSTAIADRPIRAVERIANLEGAKSWDIISTEELMQMLAEEIDIHAKGSSPLVDTPSSSTSKKANSNIETAEINEMSQPTNHSIAHDLPSLSLDTISGDNNTDVMLHSITIQEQTSKPNTEISSEDTQPKRLDQLQLNSRNMLKVKNQSKQPLEEPRSVTKDVAPKVGKKESILHLSKNILIAMRNAASRQLSKSTWIYVLDSGGQPQFADVSRPFVRSNTVIAIVHKLTDRLSSKPIFQYFIDGKPLTQPKELRMTNLQLITTYVRSISSAKLAAVDSCESESLPTFLIIGTYEDKMRGLGKLFRESLMKKNAQLIAALQQYKDQLIFYNEAKQELIFPVDNICLQNREKLSSRIRTYVIGHDEAVVKKKVPIRWYVLESNIKGEGEKNDLGIVSATQCQDIGKTLQMTESQIQGAIAFFKSLSVFLHFNTCSHLVFTNPQYFLDALSNIIRISFVDFPEMLLQKGKILPPNAHRRLQQEGLFTIDLLDLVSIQFAPGLFEKADLLRLLCHLCIVAEVHRDESTYYFVPTALSPKHLTTNNKKKFTKTCEPLVLSFQQGVMPQVRIIKIMFCLHSFVPRVYSQQLL